MSQEKKRSAAKELVDSLLEQTQPKSGKVLPSATVTEASQDKTLNLSEIRSKQVKGDFADHTQPVSYVPSDLASLGEVPQVPLSQEIDDEKTFRMNSKSGTKMQPKISFGRVSPQREVRGSSTSISVEASLTQSENLRVAQNRILELEKEADRLRRENEQLLAAGETLRRKADEMLTRTEKAESGRQYESQNAREEKRLMQDNVLAKDRESHRLKQKIEELELRLESDLKKIRVRERELENRLELMKMEEAALIRNKDDIILDLKRRNDQLEMELENYRSRGLELHKQLEGDQERFRRTVRALRLALSMLEENQEAPVPLKKVD